MRSGHMGVFTRLPADKGARFPIEEKSLKSPTTALQTFIDDLEQEYGELTTRYALQATESILRRRHGENAGAMLDRMLALKERWGERS